MNNDIKKDVYGNIDIEFYVAKAKEERDEYISEFFTSLKATIASKLSFKLPKISLHFGRHAH